MIGYLFAILMFGVLVGVVRATSVPGRDERIMSLMVWGFLLRMVVQTFSRNLSLFSHGGGGDWYVYEMHALEITRIWHFQGFGFITATEFPDIGPTSLPPNLFALIIALNGDEPTPIGCTSLIACMACLTCLNVYHLATELGSDSKQAFKLTALFLFSPAFLLYTSDMYKDGAVLFFVVGAVASSIRLSRRFSAVHLVAGLVCLAALWYVRFYLVFVTAAPLLVGLTGARSKSAARPLFTALVLAFGFIVIAATTDVFESVTERATQTFESGNSQSVRMSNAGGDQIAGSGVVFDDGGNAFGAMGPKLAYMLFSPFPWAGGSIGFHLGKIDTFLWYYIMYRGYLAAREMWKDDRTTLLMLGTFLVPTTVMYATSFANVGLSLRQRLVVVMVGAVLAMLSWRKKAVEAVAAEPVPAVPAARPLLPSEIRAAGG